MTMRSRRGLNRTQSPPLRLVEATTAERRAYFARLGKWRKQIGALDRAQQAELIRFLSDARKGIITAMSSATDFRAYHLRELQAEFKVVMDTFASRYGQLMVGAQRAHADMGWSMVFDQMEKLSPDALGKMAGITGLSADVLESAALMSGDLITNITATALQNINREVRFASMGIKSPWDAMGAIGKNLTDPSVFGTIKTRAEVILRTETGRIRSQAGQAAMDRVKDVHPRVRKKWLWSGIGRAEHAEIDGVEVKVDEEFTDGYGNSGMQPRLFGEPESDIACGCTTIIVLAKEK